MLGNKDCDQEDMDPHLYGGKQRCYSPPNCTVRMRCRETGCISRSTSECRRATPSICGEVYLRDVDSDMYVCLSNVGTDERLGGLFPRSGMCSFHRKGYVR